MARLAPLDRSELVDFEPLFTEIEAAGGAVPRSMLTMARVPALVRAFDGLNRTVYSPGAVEPALKRMVAHVASRAAGCQYCAAHNGLRAGLVGVEQAKLDELWEFESSSRFTDAERAALRLAAAAAQVPSGATDEHLVDLGRYFREDQVVELIAVIAMTGFTNRWNETLATELEDAPAAFAATQRTWR